MRLITGDECGLLKETVTEIADPKKENGKKTIHHSSSGISRLESNGVDKMCRSRGVVDMAFCQRNKDIDDECQGDTVNNDSSFAFGALRANGSFEYWVGNAPNESKEDRSSHGKYSLSYTLDDVFHAKDKERDTSESASSIGRPIGMVSALQYQNFAENKLNRSNIVACCSSLGSISIIDVNNLDKGVQAKYNAFTIRKDGNKLNSIKGTFTNRDVATTIAMDNDARRLVVGGRERSAIMLDLETGKHIWKAKNLPPNPQTLLQQQIWSTASQFLSQTDTASIGGSDNLLALGTAYKQIQIYDVRADATQRRPILYTPEWDINKENLLDHRVTSLCQLDANRIVVGDTAGFITTLDLRKINNQKGRSISANVGRFNGSAGSVRQIVKHESLPIIACVGLDRMLRTYDMNTRKQMNVIYLKQRLKCMLFCADNLLGDDDDDEIIEGGISHNEMDEIIEGDINDADEVMDYVDSSADNDSEEDSENENYSSDTAEEVSDSEEESPKAKRRRK